MADDYTANGFTTGLLGVGPAGRASGILETRGDVDWFKVDLTHGNTYKFTLSGSLPLRSNNSMINLYDPNGNILKIAIGDRYSITTEISEYTITVDGKYFVEVRDLFNVFAVSYNIAVDLIRAPILGTTSADVLTGTATDDNIVGLSGNDILIGGGGNDYLFGEEGDDRFDGGSGQNRIYGGPGIDTVAFPFDRQDYVLSKDPKSGQVEVTQKAGGSDLLFEIEKVETKDGVVDVASLGYWGAFTNVRDGSSDSVYRFFNARDKAFFYTSSSAERDMIISMSSPIKNNIDEWPYIYQGSTFEAAHKYAGATALFRFYNTSTGHHFFTASKAEADYVRAQSASGAWPFNDEGVAYRVYSTRPANTDSLEVTEVHRFYSPSLNRHFFTASQSEIEAIRLTGVWNDEGVGFFAETLGGG